MPSRNKPRAPKDCPTCNGSGETTESVRVGRKRRDTGHRQAGLCLDCLGTGTPLSD